MIHINDNDLEASLRALSAQSGHTLTNIARALMRIGLRSKPTAISAEIAACHRPLGRPPVLTKPKEQAETKEQQKQRLKKESDRLQYGTK